MKTVWEKHENYDEIMQFNELYKAYLNASKTEREATDAALTLAIERGFKSLDSYNTLKPNDKVYYINRNKNICLFVIGEESMLQGMNILGAHIDSPRIDLKQNPLYEQEGLALLDTHYYGGIKKYQWVASPLAIHGVVCKKDGSIVKVIIGEDDSDPVVGISDLLIHLAGDQMQKKASVVIEGEDLNVLVGSIPAKNSDEKELVKQNILDLLKAKYDIEEADFISAELEIVPAGKARDYGLDRSMIMSYGQDDRVCAYTSLRAILDVDRVKRTSCCILVDKEEVGSIGNTGMHSRSFENIVAKVMDKLGIYSSLNLNECFRNSYMLSSDVTVAFDPNYPSVTEAKNTAYFGKGLCFAKYTGSRGKGGCNDANAEYMAKIRKVMDENDVYFQTSELGRVDQGGGGTIAYILAQLDMEVIDAGIAVQNMHAQYEVTSKADVYEGYLGYKAFLKDMDH